MVHTEIGAGILDAATATVGLLVLEVEQTHFQMLSVSTRSLWYWELKNLKEAFRISAEY